MKFAFHLSLEILFQFIESQCSTYRVFQTIKKVSSISLHLHNIHRFITLYNKYEKYGKYKKCGQVHDHFDKIINI